MLHLGRCQFRKAESGGDRMSLSHIYKLVRKYEPTAVRHRDHICAEPVAHDLAHCPKPSGSQYAWRVSSPERRARIGHRG